MIHCSTCHQITAVDPCSICSDPRRDQTKLCVVEEPFNIEPIERTGEFHGSTTPCWVPCRPSAAWAPTN